MTAEQRLSAFLREGRGPDRDPVFTAEVMRQVARRELGVRLGTSAVLAVAAAIGLWACAPILNAVLVPMAQTLPPVAALLTLTAVRLGRRQHVPVIAPTPEHRVATG